MHRDELIQAMKEQAAVLRTDLITAIVCTTDVEEAPEMLVAAIELRESARKLTEGLSAPSTQVREELAGALASASTLVTANLDGLTDDELAFRLEMMRQLSHCACDILFGMQVVRGILHERAQPNRSAGTAYPRAVSL